MGLMDFFKGSKKTATLEPMKEDWQKDIQTKLSDFIGANFGGYKPGADYSSLSKMMTPSIYEQQGLDYLQDYTSGGIKSEGVMGQAEEVLSKTLGGEYDPFTSKYYESLRKNIEKERKQSMKTLNQQISKAGLGGSSYRAGRISDVNLESLDKVSDLLANFQENERANQLNAIQTAMGFSTTQEGQIQNKLSTIMNVGKLPRELESVGYADFMRKQGEYGSVVDLANQLYQYNVPYGMKEMGYRNTPGFTRALDYQQSMADIIATFIPGTNPRGGPTSNTSTNPVG